MAKYTDVIVEVKGQIGTIKLNRPKQLNSFGGNLALDVIAAFKELDNHPDTVFTVLTGEGRFFSAGADVKAVSSETKTTFVNDTEKKIHFVARFATALELMRTLIDHRKVFVLALNGPGVGGGAVWFQGIADIVLASTTCYLQVPFSSLGLVPENGSALSFAQHMGIHRANDFLMFGRKLSAQELESWGMVNRIFPVDGFHGKVESFLQEQLSVNDGKSMMEMKRLQNQGLREGRILAVYNSVDALADRFVEDAPKKRFEAKKRELEAKSKAKL
ncbi:peroxisomal d3-d2-enoyl-CoA isomeras-like protein [Venturia nashicola]|uniref:Peroxisomal d3-d2-enoyl-CoA isomeras-like protein n=1 Tax=Venturia nashicola TaxID=86259 RepID=A0A4Z1P3V8_9PEZI|nr:peroxisomal d3-d2-enoyl-CoA isomeras-like protein [Venturia nashicola]TLD35541.1 peroxisomal d3-d2-enoyl-CoA isomeras-like protein [Venturia nashicola]